MDENAYKKELQALTNMQKQQLVKDLDYQKQSDLSTIDRQVAVAKPQFQQQRLDRNVGSQIQKLNFAEFLQRRGQTNSGFANQAELSRQNMLSRNIGAIDTSENQFNTDMANRTADIQSNYSNRLSSGQAGIQQNMADRLLNFKEQLRQEQLQKQLKDLDYQRQISEQMRREQVQARNSELDFQRQLQIKNLLEKKGNPEFDDYGKTQQPMNQMQSNMQDVYDNNSILKLGLGPLSPQQVDRMIDAGQLNAKIENGKIVVSKPTRPQLSTRGFF
jgi:hypothetical protein